MTGDRQKRGLLPKEKQSSEGRKRRQTSTDEKLIDFTTYVSKEKDQLEEKRNVPGDSILPYGGNSLSISNTI